MPSHIDIVVLVRTVWSSNAVILCATIGMCLFVRPGEPANLLLQAPVGTMHGSSRRRAIIVRWSCIRCAIMTFVGDVGNVGALAGIAQTTDASPECSRFAARTPCPARSIAGWHVVEAEGEVGGGKAHEVAEQDVEAVVTEIIPSRGGDPDGCAERRKSDAEKVNRRGGSLPADGLNMVILLRMAHGDLAGNWGWRRRSIVPLPFLLVRRGEGVIVVLHARWEGCARKRVRHAVAGCDKGDVDGELAGDEEGEIDETSRSGRRMAAWVAAEAIVEFMVVSLLADVGGVEATSGSLADKAAYGIASGILIVWLATVQKVGSRLAEPVLRALGEEPSDDK